MDKEVANALDDTDKDNDKNIKKKKRKTSNNEEEAEMPTVPDKNEEENADLMIANPENNKIHLAHIQCLNDQIYQSRKFHK